MIDSSNLNVSRIAEGLSQGKRFDMRDVDEYRDIKIELGVSKKAEGSAKVRIGKTESVIPAINSPIANLLRQSQTRFRCSNHSIKI